VVKQLAIPNTNVLKAEYGHIPKLGEVRFDRDVVFTWNGTTSGVCVPNGDWIPDKRSGLTFCDATSAAFAIPLPWPKLDVVTYSWQKVLGGEAQHGTIILSPRAYSRLETWQPNWPIPKVFRMAKNLIPMNGFFEADTINTPSMLCIEDVLDALKWAEAIGGGEVLFRRNQENFALLANWVRRTPWIDFLASHPNICSPTSVCLKIIDPWFLSLSPPGQRVFVKKFCILLQDEGAAFDINGYREAPPGIRIWAGSTVEKNNIMSLLPWLEWGFFQAKKTVEKLT